MKNYLCGINDSRVTRPSGNIGIERVLKCDRLSPSFHCKTIILWVYYIDKISFTVNIKHQKRLIIINFLTSYNA